MLVLLAKIAWSYLHNVAHPLSIRGSFEAFDVEERYTCISYSGR